MVKTGLTGVPGWDVGALAPVGGNGAVVETDESYLGDEDEATHRTMHGKAGLGSERALVALVERGGSFALCERRGVDPREATPPLHRSRTAGRGQRERGSSRRGPQPGAKPYRDRSNA